MTKIEPINIPTKGVGKYFSMRAINIELPGTDATFYWSVFTEVEDDLEQPMPGNKILEGNLFMSTSEYNQWGEDDEYVIDWALQQLGFSKLTE
jgi:hypothetical protein